MTKNSKRFYFAIFCFFISSPIFSQEKAVQRLVVNNSDIGAQAALSALNLVSSTNATHRKTTEGNACSLIFRIFSSAGVDLKSMLMKDIQRNSLAYPASWSLSKLKPRNQEVCYRIGNLRNFFKRQGCCLDTSTYKPGDIVAWRMHTPLARRNRHQIGVVSPYKSPHHGTPLIIFHDGHSVKLADCLSNRENQVMGHYRLTPRLQKHH